MADTSKDGKVYNCINRRDENPFTGTKTGNQEDWLNLFKEGNGYQQILDAATSSRILKAKQKLGVFVFRFSGEGAWYMYQSQRIDSLSEVHNGRIDPSHVSCFTL